MPEPRRPHSFIHRSSGIFLAATSVVCLAAGTFILGKLAEYAADPRNADTLNADDLPAYVTAFMNHRGAFALVCLPALLCGILLAANARPRGVWYTVGLLGAVVMFGLLLACVVYFFAPLYTFREL